MDRCGQLQPEHFADPIHGRLFSEMRRASEADRRFDTVTLKLALENAGVLEDVGGTRYLAQLLSAMASPLMAPEYAEAVHDAWLRRQVIEVCNVAAEAAFIEPGASALIAATDGLMGLAERAGSTKLTTFGQAAARAVMGAEAAYRGLPGHARLDTGLAPFDDLLAGFWPGQLYYLMARSRTGKSAMMMQVIRHIARQFQADAAATGKPPAHALVFSMEMTADDLAVVNLASETRWTADQIRAGQIGDARAWMDLTRAGDALGSLPILIEDQAEMDMPTMIVRARAAVRQRNVKFIGVDFLELIRRSRDQQRMGLPELIPAIGYGLKAMAKMTGVPVLALRQANKSRDNDVGSRPTLSDLPYDGGQAADNVFALFRKELTMGDAPPDLVGKGPDKASAALNEWKIQREAARGVAEIGALKRRFGPANLWRTLKFDGPRMTFSQPTDGAPDLWSNEQ
jgi:replicative DNA helicase